MQTLLKSALQFHERSLAWLPRQVFALSDSVRKIPANLITRFLGWGKTTAIRGLLDDSRLCERWSILMNGYGTVSIDHTEFEPATGEVAVQKLAGGCKCQDASCRCLCWR
jgi:hypothetical protein